MGMMVIIVILNDEKSGSSDLCLQLHWYFLISDHLQQGKSCPFINDARTPDQQSNLNKQQDLWRKKWI